MTDIALSWDFLDGWGDWSYTNGDLTVDQDLSTSVLLSLFTDRLSAGSFIPPDGSLDRRGWWGDTYSPDLWGSRLWQLSRAKKLDNSTILLQARDYCNESLQWMITDGIVSTVVVNTSWAKTGFEGSNLDILVTLTQPGKLLPQRYNYQWAWDFVPIPERVAAIPIPAPIKIILPADVLGTFILGHDALGANAVPNNALIARDGSQIVLRDGKTLLLRN